MDIYIAKKEAICPIITTSEIKLSSFLSSVSDSIKKPKISRY